MATTETQEPPAPGHHTPVREPDAPPVDPDQGPVPAMIPDDLEKQRVVQPSD